MISLKECLHMIEMRLVDGLVFLCNFMFLFYDSEDLLQVVEACSRGGIPFPWQRTSTITIMSFRSYRDAIQLHDSLLNASLGHIDVHVNIPPVTQINSTTSNIFTYPHQVW